MLPYAKDILQVLDHVGIYLLIAGSYTPFMMIALHHNTSANVLLVVEWVTALVGICVSLATSGVGCSSQATNFVEVIIYLAMGCAVFCVWEQVVTSVPLMALRLLIAGGLAYIFGA
jgi:hemolysin III